MNKTTRAGTKLPISKIKGKDYLEVKWRLVWFREEHPDWSIETKIVSHDENRTVVEARIFNEVGRVIATAHKQEDKKGFFDHLEKAETGAIGRALALCGYGTQFDGGELAEGERLADAPIASPKVSKDQYIDAITQKIRTLTDNGKDTAKLKLIYRELGVTGFYDLKKLTGEELAKMASVFLGEKAC